MTLYVQQLKVNSTNYVKDKKYHMGLGNKMQQSLEIVNQRGRQENDAQQVYSKRTNHRRQTIESGNAFDASRNEHAPRTP